MTRSQLDERRRVPAPSDGRMPSSWPSPHRACRAGRPARAREGGRCRCRRAPCRRPRRRTGGRCASPPSTVSLPVPPRSPSLPFAARDGVVPGAALDASSPASPACSMSLPPPPKSRSWPLPPGSVVVAPARADDVAAVVRADRRRCRRRHGSRQRAVVPASWSSPSVPWTTSAVATATQSERHCRDGGERRRPVPSRSSCLPPCRGRCRHPLPAP